MLSHLRQFKPATRHVKIAIFAFGKKLKIHGREITILQRYSIVLATEIWFLSWHIGTCLFATALYNAFQGNIGRNFEISGGIGRR